MASSPEEQRRNLTYVMGECTFAWSQVEYALTQMFVRMMGNDRLAAIAFEAVISLEARRSMIADVMKAALKDENHPLFEEWKSIDNKISAKYKKRNALAHADILVDTRKGKGGKCYVLPFPVISSTKAIERRLSLDDLKERREKFMELAQAIREFNHRLSSVLPRLPTSHG